MDVEKIREELNKKFEWDGSPLAFHALKKTLASFMKRECVRLKLWRVKNLKCGPPTYYDERA